MEKGRHKIDNGTLHQRVINIAVVFFAFAFWLIISEGVLQVAAIYLPPIKNIFERLEDRLASADFTTDTTTEDNQKKSAIDDDIATHALHPYLGFTDDPTHNVNVNRFGFHGTLEIKKRAKDTIIVGIFGGSVADQLYRFSEQELKEQLAQIPEFSGKKIIINSLALGGYKQPQQLMALNYMLSLGMEFDVIINIDGFNEVALPIAENYLLRISPYYPRFWNVYTRRSMTKSQLKTLMDLETVQQYKKDIAHVVRASVFGDTMFGLVLWHFLNTQLEHKIISLNSGLNQLLAIGERSFQTSGPDAGNTEESYINTSVYVWKNASLQMAKIAQSNNALYVHVLQPNQHVPNTKIFSNEERIIAQVSTKIPAVELATLWSYKYGAEVGYPLLIKSGNELIRQGVNFVDLTGIFRDVRETIYKDACCHYNQKGYDMVARAIAAGIVRN